ncbi:MAG: hypothetical protein A2504_17000 [Bdellovibrionales bacterium RIFOXYD12_FULL_39_22]|nr:MAG: hypothetical protein A2385_17825 [Bdellovibrionales bacterium RIFOXYB1_FULL_39_21]OFZ44032.1 MAG: hypothetical protein A2485_14960 [Bdellovibrionales bacterium RIFOXYC12_FULL_39_17]OFZ48285.1 MAG: hypothetical protein A2404_08690 [Bdellovibrionales bacterium RIFOXYC1_FULL_39_130]OFZ76613.1 MAG: hypothetical protein A2560_17770 [Bdellovibrionales bacterium RIFOXYD1_FULL_39_84]OFZ76969.1 MAG: hypothetical protein A2451_11310 [Bdellovibrionales bacterium RIFOXYC2_FULL_39_8]OFZ95534.1 MAG:
MRQHFAPQGAYEDILRLIGQWRILDFKTLASLTTNKIEYPNLLKKIQKLEQTNFIKCTYLGNRAKYFYLSSKGIKLVGVENGYEMADENLAHDIITGVVLRGLQAFKTFTDGQMLSHDGASKVNADAKIIGIKDENKFKIDLEIELTQKSKNRIQTKFARHAMSSESDYCFYITNKLGLYKSYCSYLSSMSEKGKAFTDNILS